MQSLGDIVVPTPDVFYSYVVRKYLGQATAVWLPSDPAFNQRVQVKDGSGNAGTYNITVEGNGNTIDGQSTLVLNANYAFAELTFNGFEWSLTGSNLSGGGGGGVTFQEFVATGASHTTTRVNTFVGWNSSTASGKTQTIPTSAGSLGIIIISDLAGTAGQYPITVAPQTGSITGVNEVYTNYGSITLLDTTDGWVST